MIIFSSVSISIPYRMLLCSSELLDASRPYISLGHFLAIQRVLEGNFKDANYDIF